MPSQPVIDAFFDPATFTITYLVGDPASRRAAIIDPVRAMQTPTGSSGLSASACRPALTLFAWPSSWRYVRSPDAVTTAQASGVLPA